MTDDMVDRVAASMEARRRELIAKPLAQIWPELAEAAFEAMREPTSAMVRASWRVTEIVPKDERLRVLLLNSQSAHEVKALNRWRAMIDAALTPACSRRAG